MASNADGTIVTRLTGYDLLNDPRLNKGMAFSEEERNLFSLHGLLPPHISTLPDQMARRKRAFDTQLTPLAQYGFMRDLQDSNETLFYALIAHNIEQMLPIVYTPTVGEGCQRFSEIWHKTRGIFLSYSNKERIDQILSHPRFDPVRCIVVSDGERILGLGDQGAGGMGIPIGKMALYTALAGIHPEQCLPVLLDVGTDNEERLNDPLYVGWRSKRIRGEEYDAFVDAFVQAVKRRWPHVLLQWEDFAGSNASRLLTRYRDEICTFNDDIQGTAAVATATILSAINVTGIPLKEQRFAVYGFGSAGLGISKLLLSVLQDAGLSEKEAYSRFWALDRHGLIVEGINDIRTEQMPFMRARAEVASWQLSAPGEIGLFDVAHNAKPTVLIGVSGQPGAFTEVAVREMAKNTQRPVIFPLSNPTSRSEAMPQQLLEWTEGRALIGTGSPFAPVQLNGKTYKIDQTNNSYIFPGLALGIISSNATRVSDDMIKVAAKTLADLCPTRTDKNASLLPPLESIRDVSHAVALAVGTQAIKEGQSKLTQTAFEQALSDNIWEPVYRPFKLAQA